MDKKSRVLITGGEGFIGKNLLLAMPHLNITTLGRRMPSDQRATEFIRADIRNYRIDKNEFSHIIHCAEAGVEATENVVKSGANILLISSGAAIHPGTQYADAKIASEKIVKEAGGIVCRLFSFMGPYLPFDGSFAAGNFIRDALLTGNIHIKGDGTAVRSYMHTSEMAKWVWNLFDHGKPGYTYSVGSNEPVTILQLANKIAKLSSKRIMNPVEVHVDFSETQSFGPHHYVPDLGFGPTISLDETIDKTLDWAIESFM